MTLISPVNTLVTTVGNYCFFDFIRIGQPLPLSVVMAPWLLPFHP